MSRPSAAGCAFGLALAAAPLLASCARPEAPPTAPPPSAAASAAPAEHAPRPFTAEQIRDSMPAGTEIRYRREADGKPPVVSVWTVTAADAETCTILSRLLAEDGTLIADEGTSVSKWTELMAHATFPAASTVRTDAVIEVPAGKFETWLYEVRRGTGAAAGTVERFYFAESLPGPPVLLVMEDGGRLLMRMTLLSRK